MVKLAPEGYPFIYFFGIVSLAAFMLGGIWVALLPLVLTAFMAYFFRDPERTAPEGENIFISPADGKIIVAEKTTEDVFIRDETLKISVFMSPFNVHVNRAPCDGVVETVVYTPGKFLAAFKPEASLQNENIAMVLDTIHGKVLVRQIAGFVARRAVCRVKPGDILKKGERYGMIKFSSRLDIYLPKDTAVKVKLGDIVKAGESVLGMVA